MVATQAKQEEKVELTTVTPEMALNWINENRETANRHLNNTVVAKYASDIANGNWQVNGSSIVFSKDGKLLDGQHRLHAIVKAGKPVQTLVITGVDEIAFETIDTGLKRRVADALHIMGYPQSNALATLAHLTAYFAKHGTLHTGMHYVVPTTQEVLAFVARDGQLMLDAIRQTVPVQRQFTHSSIYAFYYMKLGEINVHDRDVFFEQLERGENLQEGDPVYALRRVLGNYAARRNRAPRVIIGAVLVKAWNAFREHRSIKNLSFSATEDYPTPV